MMTGYSQANFYTNIIQKLIDNCENQSIGIITKYFKVSDLKHVAFILKILKQGKEIKESFLNSIRIMLENTEDFSATRNGFKKALMHFYDQTDEGIIMPIVEVFDLDLDANNDLKETVYTDIKVSSFNWREIISKRDPKPKPKKKLEELKGELAGTKEDLKKEELEEGKNKLHEDFIGESEEPETDEDIKIDIPKSELHELDIPPIEKKEEDIKTPQKKQKDLDPGDFTFKSISDEDEIPEDEIPEDEIPEDEIDYSEFEEHLDEINPNTAAIEKILKTKSIDELIKIIEDKTAPPEVVSAVIPSVLKKSEAEIQEFASSDKLSPEILVDLFSKASKFARNWRVRLEIVGNENVPQEIIDIAVHDKDYRVRMEAVGNSKFDNIEAIEKLYRKEPNKLVKMELIKNPNTPEHILAKIYEEQIKNVETQSYEERIIALSKNPKAKSEILNELLNEAREELGLESWKDPKLNSVRRDSVHLTIIENLASNPRLPEELFRKLGSSIRSDIRMAIAKNENAPIGLIKYMAENDMDAGVRIAAANNLKNR